MAIQLNATKRGLITGIAMIAASLFSFYILKNPIETNFQLIVYLIFTAGISWSLLNYFKTNPENNSFKDYFSVGFKSFVVVVLLMAIYTYIFFKFHIEFRDNKIAENSRLLLLEGNHTPQEVEENAGQLKNMFMPIMISTTIFRYLIIGALVSAIGGGFLSNKKASS